MLSSEVSVPFCPGNAVALGLEIFVQFFLFGFWFCFFVALDIDFGN